MKFEGVFLKVSSMKGIIRCRKKGKLIPILIGPFEIVKHVGDVAYEFSLLKNIGTFHLVFHVLMIKKCMGNPSSVVPLGSILVKDNLMYEEIPVEILDR